MNKREHDSNRVVFYSISNMAAGHELAKGEKILRSDAHQNNTDINNVLELYNIQKYLHGGLSLNSWTEQDTAIFKNKATEYKKIVGRFIANINDSNVIELYEQIIQNYIATFWELINNQSAFNRISKENFKTILKNEPYIIHTILKFGGLVNYYNAELRDHLITLPHSAEILLSAYETHKDSSKNQIYIPKSLTLEDKENIISNYLDYSDANYNYIGLVLTIRNRDDITISDRTRLKAKRAREAKSAEIFSNQAGIPWKVRISFSDENEQIKSTYIDENHMTHYSYKLDFIRQNNDPYSLFLNFRLLFDYLDEQGRVGLLSQKNKLILFEAILSVRSQNAYPVGIAFNSSNNTSQLQILSYDNVIKNTLNNSLESVLHSVFTSVFQEKFGFANNAQFSIPTSTNSYFEKVRLLAPEFESMLKQYKLFVEDGHIDFDLLQISSLPTSIKNIPSMSQKKYFYLNGKNNELINCIHLFFSDQTLLAYIEPFKEKSYRTFFNLLANEQVKFSNYEDYQKRELNYLIGKGWVTVDEHDFVQITNPMRLVILKDLNDNEFTSFHHCPTELQQEAQRMADENLIYFESSLLSKPEQAYFNYFLNKSEFTNGLDLRNSYLHGTQANPDDMEQHEQAYFTYLKLLVLVMLKIDDDLRIAKNIKSNAAILQEEDGELSPQ